MLYRVSHYLPSQTYLLSTKSLTSTLPTLLGKRINNYHIGHNVSFVFNNVIIILIFASIHLLEIMLSWLCNILCVLFVFCIFIDIFITSCNKFLYLPECV